MQHARADTVTTTVTVVSGPDGTLTEATEGDGGSSASSSSAIKLRRSSLAEMASRALEEDSTGFLLATTAGNQASFVHLPKDTKKGKPQEYAVC